MLDLHLLDDHAFNLHGYSYARLNGLFLRAVPSSHLEGVANPDLARFLDSTLAAYTRSCEPLSAVSLELLNGDCLLCQGDFFPGCSCCRGTNLTDVPLRVDALGGFPLSNIHLSFLQALPNCTLQAAVNPADPLVVRFDGGMGLIYEASSRLSTV